MKQAVLLAAGPIAHPERLDIPADAFLLCADAGYRAAQAIGRTPDLLMGDFDSAERPEWAGVERIVFSVEKDDTDAMLAIKELHRRGFAQVLFYGGTHGRLDHTYANLQQLSWGAHHGMKILLLDENHRAQILLPGSHEISCGDYAHFSLFSVSEQVRGLTLGGTKYVCENLDLSRLFPLGVSNRIIGESASVRFTQGELLCIQSRCR